MQNGAGELPETLAAPCSCAPPHGPSFRQSVDSGFSPQRGCQGWPAPELLEEVWGLGEQVKEDRKQTRFLGQKKGAGGRMREREEGRGGRASCGPTGGRLGGGGCPVQTDLGSPSWSCSLGEWGWVLSTVRSGGVCADRCPTPRTLGLSRS